jgi:hypothetical protein
MENTTLWGKGIQSTGRRRQPEQRLKDPGVKIPYSKIHPTKIAHLSIS